MINKIMTSSLTFTHLARDYQVASATHFVPPCTKPPDFGLFQFSFIDGMLTLRGPENAQFQPLCLFVGRQKFELYRYRLLAQAFSLLLWSSQALSSL